MVLRNPKARRLAIRCAALAGLVVLVLATVAWLDPTGAGLGGACCNDSSAMRRLIASLGCDTQKTSAARHVAAAAAMLPSNASAGDHLVCLDDIASNQDSRQLARVQKFWASHPERPLPAENDQKCVNTSTLSHLVMVAGHALFVGASFRNESNSSWFLEPYQVGHETAIVAQIREGVRLADADSSALLVFSGGVSRHTAGPISEGISYWLFADHHDWWGANPLLRLRAAAEDFAWDSLQNLLFSLCRFREVTGSYPARITVVGMPFKEARFRTVHAEAARWPASRFDYVGVGSFAPRFEEYERTRVIPQFRRDLYACHGDLALKKGRRNRARRWHGYLDTCPEIADLLIYCPDDPAAAFSGPLPWR